MEAIATRSKKLLAKQELSFGHFEHPEDMGGSLSANEASWRSNEMRA